MSMSLSVIVPSYNHALFVERTLRSIFAQTLHPKELIVVDDGSKDESVLIIERILKDAPFSCELIARENRGLSATLNEGLARATGEFFAYLGSDDVWLRAFLEKRCGILANDANAVLVCGHAFVIDEDDFIIDRTDKWVQFSGGNMLPYLLRGQIFASSGVVYRRAAIERYGWNEDSILEDYELYLKLAADGEFAFDDELLSGWRQHGRNVSRDFPLMMSEWIAAQDRVAEKLNLTRDELNKIQRELKFDAVLSFVRHGHRREGLRLFCENLRGAKSLSQIGKTLFRFSIPPAIFEWNRRRKKTRTKQKYGRLEI